MLRNYFKTALRNLARSKLHSIINITGLSVGMAVAMLIGLWIYDEVSFDADRYLFVCGLSGDGQAGAAVLQ